MTVVTSLSRIWPLKRFEFQTVLSGLGFENEALCVLKSSVCCIWQAEQPVLCPFTPTQSLCGQPAWVETARGQKRETYQLQPLQCEPGYGPISQVLGGDKNTPPPELLLDYGQGSEDELLSEMGTTHTTSSGLGTC